MRVFPCQEDCFYILSTLVKGGTWGFCKWAVAFVVIAGIGCGVGDGDDPLAGRTADPDEVRKAMSALEA